MALLRNFKLVSRSMSLSRQSAPMLVTPIQVDQLRRQKKISFLDASWFMPNSPRDPFQDFISERIPGARFLDLDQVASQHPLGLKHMMPEDSFFAETCEMLGIEPSQHVVIYDTPGIFSAPRALFMFRSFGHLNSSVLDGGLPAWLAQGLPIESGPPVIVNKTRYPIPTLEAQSLRNYEQIVENSTLDPSRKPTADLVLDARSRGRFLGTEPEPRHGLSSGHIPQSFSLPFNLFLRKQAGPDGTDYTTFLPRDDIRQALVEAVGATRAQLILSDRIPVTTSCGSGMTAGILWLGLKLIGVKKISLYDESWTGYAMRDTSKIDRSQ